MVDDNADRQRHAGQPVRERDISEHYRLEVADAHGRPAHEAEAAVQRAGVSAPVMWARTDKGIKVFAVGSSGLDPVGEHIFCQIAW